ncbi:hypothetical protein ACWCW2_43400, partial [Streptomyces sp. NPDC001773]
MTPVRRTPNARRPVPSPPRTDETSRRAVVDLLPDLPCPRLDRKGGAPRTWNKGRLDSWVSGVGNVRTLGYLDRSDIP